LWTDQTTIKFIYADSGAMKNSLSVDITPSSVLTDKIPFSSDSTLAIIETDDTNPIYIMNVSSQNVQQTIKVDVGTISSAHFLNSSNDYIIVFGSTATLLVDIANLLQYSLPALVGTDFTTDYNNNFYVCGDNKIEQNRLSFNYYNTTANNTVNSTMNETTNSSSNSTVNESVNSTNGTNI